MNTNTDHDITATAVANANLSKSICKEYRLQPVLACKYLVDLSATWKGTMKEFVLEAEKLTQVKQAHVYRILKLRVFIRDFGVLLPEQQPSWFALRLLVRELSRDQMMDAWMTAVWSNQGLSSGLSRTVLRQSIQAVKKHAKAIAAGA